LSSAIAARGDFARALTNSPVAVGLSVLLYPSEIGPEWSNSDDPSSPGFLNSIGKASIGPPSVPGGVGPISLVDLLTNEGFDPKEDVAFFHGTTSTGPLLAGQGLRQNSRFFVTSSRATASVFAARTAAKYGGTPTAVLFVLPKITFEQLQTAGLVVQRSIDLGGIEYEFAPGAADVLNQFGTIIPLE
jgi:hypothetical protein